MKSYKILDKYLLRVPLLSLGNIDNISVEKLHTFYDDPYILEAIFLSSPELHKQIAKLKSGFLSKKEEEKIRLSLLKFLLRMSYRCTPFGLFAGISLGRFKNEATCIELDNYENYNRVTRLDMNFLCSLTQEIEKEKKNRYNLLYFPNSSLYVIGSKYRYIEFKYINSSRFHYIISIDSSPYIDEVLKISKNGIKIEFLVNEILNKIDDHDISENDVEDYIHELIDNQILISSISPCVSGEDYLNLITKNTNIEWIKKLQVSIKLLDENLYNNPDNYKKIIELIEEAEVPFHPKFLFQTDLRIASKSNFLNIDIKDDLFDSLIIFEKFKRTVVNQKIEKFKKAFVERYEDEEVSLGLALDVESGIGYDQNQVGSYDINPLIDDLFVLKDIEDNQSDSLSMNDLLFSKIEVNKLISDHYEIVLNDEDFDNSTLLTSNYPNTFSIHCSIYEDNEEKPIVVLSNIGGNTASSLLGRFAHLSEDISNYIGEIMDYEHDENMLVAEIIHLPEARTGNVLFRAKTRKYEIPYLAKSNLQSNNQIDISDIKISIIDDKIILRSQKHNKYLKVYLSNAHNYSRNSVPIYHFLCDLQSQNVNNGLDLQWKGFSGNQTFFPRIRYRNIIISKAQWIFTRETISTLVDVPTILMWQKRYNVPDTFILIQNNSDNEIPITLSNDMSIKLFIIEVKESNSIILKEFLRFKSIAKKGGEFFNNEFIFSVCKK